MGFFPTGRVYTAVVFVCSTTYRLCVILLTFTYSIQIDSDSLMVRAKLTEDSSLKYNYISSLITPERTERGAKASFYSVHQNILKWPHTVQTSFLNTCNSSWAVKWADSLDEGPHNPVKRTPVLLTSFMHDTKEATCSEFRIRAYSWKAEWKENNCDNCNHGRILNCKPFKNLERCRRS